MSLRDDSDVHFFCDAMLGGLARWLRAWGYDAAFEYGIDDGDLVARAEQTGAMILSSDGPLFDRTVIATGRVKALYVPQQLSRDEQLDFVVRELRLPRRTGRCMACGGELVEVPRHSVTDEAPPLAFKNCKRFWRCQRCDKLLWHGTHWHRIERRLGQLGDDDMSPGKGRRRGTV